MNDRSEFLELCAHATREIHLPILGLAHGGKLNPSCLGYPDELRAAMRGPNRQLLGQSSVGFPSAEAYHLADHLPSLWAQEYGVVGTEESVDLAREINRLYFGNGSIVTPSGLAAINVALGVILSRHPKRDVSILVPEHVYYPVWRLLTRGAYSEPDQVFRYGPSEESFEAAVARAMERGKPPAIVYIESPVSNRFDTHDLSFLVRRAKSLNAITVQDNTNNSFVGCQPIRDYGVDVVAEAGTKYMGGYADCPYGFVVCKSEVQAEEMAFFGRTHGACTLAPGIALLASHRLSSTSERMEQSFRNAADLRRTVFEPMREKGLVDEILYYDPLTSGKSETRQQYTRGNGLTTVVFSRDISEAQRNQFLDESPLVIPAASWGGHVTVATVMEIAGKPATRIHAGMEASEDLVRSFQTSSERVFGFKPTSS